LLGDRILLIGRRETEGRIAAPHGRRQSDQPQPGNADAIAPGAIAAFLGHDLPEQSLKGRHEMRLIEHDQSVDAEQAGVQGPHPSRHAVAFEKQPRPDHVDRADDDCRCRRVAQPVAVVDPRAAQRGDRQRGIGTQAQSLAQLAGAGAAGAGV
jgi:hypothetical protein